MGNNDGMLSALANEGNNSVCDIDKDTYFSFAYGNEIALVWKQKYYILNCTCDLWKEVQIKVKQVKSFQAIKKWWKLKSKIYEISDWSNNFNELK